MAFLFGGDVETSRSRPADPIKDMQGELRNAMRSILRETTKSTQQEKGLITEIKRYAAVNKLQLATLKAKELVRLRSHQERLQTTHCQLTSLHQNLATVSSTQVMHDAMAKTTKLLQNLRGKMNPATIMKNMRAFQTESENFQTTQQTLQESLDDVFQSEDEAHITEQTIGQVFEELGLDLSGKLTTPVQPLSQITDKDLEARFQRLKASQFRS